MTFRRALIGLGLLPVLAVAGLASACPVGDRQQRAELMGTGSGSFIEFAPPMATRHLRP